MTQVCAESPAFREAQLKSERLRIRIVLGVIATAFLLRVLRTVVIGGHENVSSLLMICSLLAVFSAYEYSMLRAVSRAIQNGRECGSWVWLSNIIWENCLPALAVAFLSSGSIDPIYRPLANPAGLAFFLLISLSTLRLNPAVCRLSGLTAAISYLVAAAYLGWRPALSSGTSLLSPQKAVFGYAMAMVICGFASGMVAGEIRKQVEAALREAEARRRADRLEHDLSVARSIQQGLLPNVAPEISGFEFAGWNQPAEQTGGDYYDWQVLPNGTVVAELADVTGHGIGPAMLAAVCRAYARAHFGRGNSLLDAMGQLNAELTGDVGEGRFVTFVAAVCVPGCKRVELLSAGHGPLFVYSLSEDRFEEISAQGLPLGISSQFVSDPPRLLELSKGDFLVLATDGFLEWTNAEGEQFEVKRIEETIRKSKEKRPSELIATLYAAVLKFSAGTKQQDDLTAVVIKRT